MIGALKDCHSRHIEEYISVQYGISVTNTSNRYKYTTELRLRNPVYRQTQNSLLFGEDKGIRVVKQFLYMGSLILEISQNIQTLTSL